MGDDYYIREADEYSEETHSDDLFEKSNNKRGISLKKKATEVTALLQSGIDEKQNTASKIDDNGRSLQKRINELINSRYMPGVETPEQMF